MKSAGRDLLDGLLGRVPEANRSRPVPAARPLRSPPPPRVAKLMPIQGQPQGVRRLAITLMLGSLGCPIHADAAAPSVQIVTSDVSTFYRIYDAAVGHPAAETLQRDYIAAGSDALRAFTSSRGITGENLAAAILRKPLVFADARRCAEALPGIRERLAMALRKLAVLYPQAAFPPITIVIGRGGTGGTTNAAGVLIGLETLCASDFMDPDLTSRFVHLIAHEYVHVQQPAAQTEPVEPTVLFASVIEGGAEFVGELISGDVGNYQLKRWTKGREKAIEEAFVRDEDSTDLKPWLWNGPGDPMHPGDLGYWVGYRIAKSYYERSNDKPSAIRDIIAVSNAADARALLAASGWRPAG